VRVRVRDLGAEGADELVQVLVRMRALDPEFPPRSDATSDPASLARWLHADDELVVRRWVAEEEGVLVGHVHVTPVHDYLVRHLGLPDGAAFLELGKLFVDPTARGRGVGASLLTAARDFARSEDAALVLAVLPSSAAAIALYRREGLSAAGHFNGVHGLNHVFTDRWRGGISSSGTAGAVRG
jgi:GNAT superfamily N-acetyltransferase